MSERGRGRGIGEGEYKRRSEGGRVEGIRGEREGEEE